MHSYIECQQVTDVELQADLLQIDPEDCPQYQRGISTELSLSFSRIRQRLAGILRNGRETLPRMAGQLWV